MTTIVNSPREDSGNGILIGIVIAVLLAIAFFVFALPYIRGSAPAADNTTGGASINVEIPGGGDGQ